MRLFRKSKVPQHVNPLVRRLFEEMNHQQIGLLDMADRSGVNHNTISDWKHRANPQIHNLAACFSVLGYELVAKPNYTKLDGDPHHEVAVTPAIGEPHGRGRAKSNNS